MHYTDPEAKAKPGVEFAEVTDEDELARKFYSKEDMADLPQDDEVASLETLYPDRV